MPSVDEELNNGHYYINKFLFENIGDEIKRKEIGTSIQIFKSKLKEDLKIYEKLVKDKNTEISNYEREGYFLVKDLKEVLENNEPGSPKMRCEFEKILDILNEQELSEDEWECLETFAEKMNKYYSDKTESSILFLNTYPK
ncbi:MAG: hypothetical protein J7L08_01665 [Candidatus Aenigmarchaeota archaeon]|nr:hypothetical protein [Candidatus Aenigmarchaeota archaeon]